MAYHYESKTRDNDENKLKKLQEDYKERLFPFTIKNIVSIAAGGLEHGRVAF